MGRREEALPALSEWKMIDITAKANIRYKRTRIVDTQSCSECYCKGKLQGETFAKEKDKSTCARIDQSGGSFQATKQTQYVIHVFLLHVARRDVLISNIYSAAINRDTHCIRKMKNQCSGTKTHISQPRSNGLSDRRTCPVLHHGSIMTGRH